MGTSTKLAIWLDHSAAYIVEIKPNHLPIMTIESKFVNSSELIASQNRTLNAYYNKIINKIKDYEKLFLFGPTTAKLELFDVLSEDHRLMKMKVLIIETPNLRPDQQEQYINNYFA
ncbi:hypothetical protein [Flavobacterium frigoris]|uniref:Uncharacterized protein n=1 Tax=Flavobacterium frigoris (strain PS1) TaxID=1086011 RepID=H7FNX5_FLAFP|nr:hypothetical protein [Flavobacterium frigoris]EIA09776.1 hypothetical protein HJ01_00873 [Flavobacterium frigoris PS1]